MSATKKHHIELEIDTCNPVEQTEVLAAIREAIQSKWESVPGLCAVLDVNAYHVGAEKGVLFSRAYCPANEQ